MNTIGDKQIEKYFYGYFYSRTCEICNVIVHRASMQKHLRSKKHLENMIQNELIIPEVF